jgi:hypothetical protein
VRARGAGELWFIENGGQEIAKLAMRAALRVCPRVTEAAPEAEADSKRLDWLEAEVEREQRNTAYAALYRRNIPITREAIDAARSPAAPPEGR